MLSAILNIFEQHVLSHPPKPIAVLLDFDGTLAPIAETPEEAEILPLSRYALARLGALPHRGVVTAIISGRMLANLHTKVDWDGTCLAGTHGLEIECGGLAHVNDEAERAAPQLVEFARKLSVDLPNFPGAWAEVKQLGVAVHYRQMEEDKLPELRTAVENAMQGYEKLTLREGKKVLEALPAVDWNKADAVRYILQRTGHPTGALVAYFGDDVTDEDAFREVNDLGGVSVKVGGGETAAKAVIEGPSDVAAFLQALADMYNV